MDGIKNYMEKWVKEQMEYLLENMNVCKCEKCKKDICALALNNLKPYYVVNEMGRVMAKLASTQNQFETDITIQVTKAIEIVSKSPKHSC